MEDFSRCTPSEFYEVWRAYVSREERLERVAWERTRMAALTSLQPWSKKRLEATDVMKFPWDERGSGDAEELSAEERAARFEAAKKRYGLR